MLPSLWVQYAGGGAVSRCVPVEPLQSGQPAEHAQSPSPRKTDVGDLCYESQPRL